MSATPTDISELAIDIRQLKRDVKELLRESRSSTSKRSGAPFVC